MKKLIISLLLVVISSVTGFAQQRGTVEYIDANPYFGDICLGDSITHNLRKLTLLEELGNGDFKCSVIETWKEQYKVGGISPFTIYVSVKDYQIKNILVYFLNERKDLVHVIAQLFKDYGEKEATKDGFNWYGKEVAVTANFSEDLKTFYIAYISLK